MLQVFGEAHLIPVKERPGFPFVFPYFFPLEKILQEYAKTRDSTKALIYRAFWHLRTRKRTAQHVPIIIRILLPLPKLVTQFDTMVSTALSLYCADTPRLSALARCILWVVMPVWRGFVRAFRGESAGSGRWLPLNDRDSLNYWGFVKRLIIPGRLFSGCSPGRASGSSPARSCRPGPRG